MERLKRAGVATISAWAAHALAWGVGLYMAFGPVYQGVSVTPTLPGEPLGEPPRQATQYTATLLEANGLWVLWLLLIPILITGLVLLTIRFTHPGQARRKALLWPPAVVLLVFCVVAIASIGMLYLPTALALLVAAIAGSIDSAAGAGESDEADRL